VRERKRRALVTGAAVFGLFIVYPVLAAFTPVLDGTVGGIGVAYILGFAEMVFAFAMALVWVRRADP
jgi:uncharacterized membrane protein (DUF485 family)